MIILPCLEFIFHNGYVFYVFLLIWLFGLFFKVVGR